MSFCDHCEGQRLDRAQVLRALRATRKRLRNSDMACSADESLARAIEDSRHPAAAIEALCDVHPPGILGHFDTCFQIVAFHEIHVDEMVAVHDAVQWKRLTARSQQGQQNQDVPTIW